MTTEEMKTMVFSGLAEKSMEGNPFDVIQALNSAQIYLTRLLDWRAVPELVLTVVPTEDTGADDDYGVPYALTRPADFLDLVSLMWEPNTKVTDVYETVARQNSQIVSIQALLTSINSTSDLLCADAGDAILLNRVVGGGWAASDREILLSYKRVPAELTSSVDPEINEKWHYHMVDYALADLWLKYGDKERAAFYNKQLLERLHGPQGQQGVQR